MDTNFKFIYFALKISFKLQTPKMIFIKNILYFIQIILYKKVQTYTEYKTIID